MEKQVRKIFIIRGVVKGLASDGLVMSRWNCSNRCFLFLFRCLVVFVCIDLQWVMLCGIIPL